EPGTLEARLTALAGPGRWLALRHAALGAEALAALPHRSGSAKNPTYFPLTPRLLAGLDTLAVLDTVTYAHGGRPLD
ncbi:MAG: erythromycin esterase family protein, partial [Candidatus Sumerlaeia bacterium]|nr:erythromycin esterase family protein [Candidatus Sumerlaeia bacterium]